MIWAAEGVSSLPLTPADVGVQREPHAHPLKPRKPLARLMAKGLDPGTRRDERIGLSKFQP
ncbi:hypothetical protein D3C87_275800 [compost metagenome]